MQLIHFSVILVTFLVTADKSLQFGPWIYPGTCASIGYADRCCPPGANCQATDGYCWCNATCLLDGRCCTDVYCSSAPMTCADVGLTTCCNSPASNNPHHCDVFHPITPGATIYAKYCSCDLGCYSYVRNDCCSDISAIGCVPRTCSLARKSPGCCLSSCYVPGGHCYCDRWCVIYGDCCEDVVFRGSCAGSPTLERPSLITTEEPQNMNPQLATTDNTTVFSLNPAATEPQTTSLTKEQTNTVALESRLMDAETTMSSNPLILPSITTNTLVLTTAKSTNNTTAFSSNPAATEPQTLTNLSTISTITYTKEGTNLVALQSKPMDAQSTMFSNSLLLSSITTKRLTLTTGVSTDSEFNFERRILTITVITVTLGCFLIMLVIIGCLLLILRRRFQRLIPTSMSRRRKINDVNRKSTCECNNLQHCPTTVPIPNGPQRPTIELNTIEAVYTNINDIM